MSIYKNFAHISILKLYHKSI